MVKMKTHDTHETASFQGDFANTTRRGALSVLLTGALGGLAAACRGRSEASGRRDARVVTAGAALTEIVFALGAGSKVVGVDASSRWPVEAQRCAQVGYARQLSAEGMLALRPTLVLASHEAGPPAVLRQVRAAGVAVVQVESSYGVAGAKARIAAVGSVLGRTQEAQSVIAQIDRDLATVGPRPARPVRVLFLYARGPGTPQVAGANTAAHAMIEHAGGTNVADWEAYRPMTAESVVAAAPEVILLTTAGLQGFGGTGGLLANPALAATPAGRARRVVAMDDQLLLAFGPRVGIALRELTAHLREAAT